MTTSNPTTADGLIAEFTALYECYTGYNTAADDDWHDNLVAARDEPQLRHAIQRLRTPGDVGVPPEVGIATHNVPAADGAQHHREPDPNTPPEGINPDAWRQFWT